MGAGSNPNKKKSSWFSATIVDPSAAIKNTLNGSVGVEVTGAQKMFGKMNSVVTNASKSVSRGNVIVLLPSVRHNVLVLMTSLLSLHEIFSPS